MKTFDYIACDSVGVACSVLDERGGSARILAGGTDLVLEMRRPGASPDAVVDISRIAGLRGISLHDGEISVGPLTTHAEISRSLTIRTRAGFLAAAAGAIGSTQIRNRGTIGGNIMNAAPCADTVPPLVALGARLTLCSLRGERVVDIEGFFDAPYRSLARENEVLTLIRFRPAPADARSVFLKLGRRNAVSIARLSVAALVERDPEGIITGARIVPGAAAPQWRRIADAEELLRGKRPSVSLFAEAGKLVSETVVGMAGRRWSTEYKEPVLAVLVRRALEICCAKEGE